MVYGDIVIGLACLERDLKPVSKPKMQEIEPADSNVTQEVTTKKKKDYKYQCGKMRHSEILQIRKERL